MKISQIGGEAALIKLIEQRYGGSFNDLALGIGDDAALIRSGDKLLIVTTDLLIENTHFRLDINEPYLVGWKSAAVNISDVAAMGGSPTYSFVSIGLPDVEVEVVEQIYDGLSDACRAFGSVIAGGDTVSSSAGIVINVAQLGEVEPDKAIKRSGAKPGDAIIVTNTLGDSRAGLEMLLKFGLAESRRLSEFIVERHLKPEPRLSEARAAASTGAAHAMMDLSDGLVSDLGKLCAASGVGAKINIDALPISQDLHIAAARLDCDPIELAAGGGEDYELLITSASADAAKIIRAVREAGSDARVIGEICEGTKAIFTSATGVEREIPPGWQHF